MSKFVRKFVLLSVVLATVLVTANMTVPTKAQDKTKIVWFVGLGSGTNDQQIAAENQVVKDFNASQDKIELEIQIAASYETAVDTLKTQIAAGNPPDIVGPVGVGNSNTFEDQWMDLKPMIEKAKLDLSSFDPALLDLYKTLNGGFSAIPFGVFPVITYYNTELFDQAGLKYPPHKFDEQYEMPDGTKVDWNYETLGKVAKLLTIDKDGNDATSDKFDASNTVQYGLNFQYALIRLMLTDIQPQQLYDGKTIKISEGWRKATQWLQDALWKDHFLVNDTADASTLMQPNAFASGHVAMSITPLWFTCCMKDVADKLKWDMGVIPQGLDGKYNVPVDADTFRMFKGTKHPEEAFQVLSYLLGEGVPKLAPVYGAFPARPEYQKAYLDAQNETYKQGVDWDVAIESLKHAVPSNMHHESNFPNWGQGQDRFSQFKALLFGDTGKDANVNAELDKLEKDLNSIAKGTFPTATPVPTAVPTEEATAAS